MRNFLTLGWKYGQFHSIKNKISVDNNGNPIPWFTYPAIEYLWSLDLTKYSVFEYGSGFSTIYWLDNAREVISVEHDYYWYQVLLRKIGCKNNINYIFASNKEDYVKSLRDCNRYFDIYVIDGQWRLECCNEVLENILRWGKGNMVIFDNSDWYPDAIELLRRHLNMIEVDFHGFGPVNDYTWTTTIFINTSSKLRYKRSLYSIGCLQKREK